MESRVAGKAVMVKPALCKKKKCSNIAKNSVVERKWKRLLIGRNLAFVKEKKNPHSQFAS